MKTNSKIKLAEFIGSIQDGGAETLIRDYVQLIDKNKFEPIIIVLRRSPSTANDKILTEKGYKIIPICKSNFFPLKVLQKLNYWWYVPYRLRKILKQEKVEVMHIHLALLHFVKNISSSIKHIRLFYTCHCMVNDFLGNNNSKENISAKYLIKNNNLRFIALHEEMKNEINELFGIDNTIVIRNGIDFNRFLNITVSKEQIRIELNIPEKSFVIGHVGRFAEQKNHTFIVDVFKEVCKRNNNAFLLLVGAGKLKTQIEEKLENLGLRGKYLILSNRSDVPQLMKAMDVFLFPSLYEGLGIVLIEAQVLGLRCIVSDTVPQEAFRTELAVPVSLGESSAKWADILLDENIKGQYNKNLDDYDMNKEIKRLEKLYIGELE